MQPSLWLILVLAIVQGITEFLPVSSSGHLVILAALFSGGDPKRLDIADLNIVLHFGTLLSILVFYWPRIRALLSEDRRVIGLLVWGTLPAVVVGLPLKKWGKPLLSDPALAGLLLLATAGVLMVVASIRHQDDDYRRQSWWQAALIGVAQAIAILPGISRSGATIAAGLGLGLSRRSAATFSFLLAIPAILGATVLELKDFFHGELHLQTPWPHLVLGAMTAFLVGLVALWWLVRWLERGRLLPFALWCIVVGLITIWLYGLPIRSWPGAE